MADIEMSLADIIKKKKVPPRNQAWRSNGGTAAKRQTFGNRNSSNPLTQTDARNKIIFNKRLRITDAREKLAELAKQKDARLKLEQLRMKKGTMRQGLGRNFAFHKVQESRDRLPRVVGKKEKVFFDASRNVRLQQSEKSKINVNRQIGYSRKPNAQRYMDDGISDYSDKPIKPILRTVENDGYMPRPIVIDEEYEPIKPTALNRKTSLNLKIIARNDEIRERSINNQRETSEREKEKSTSMPPSILKKRPMAATRSDKKHEAAPPAEYRIVVSNLKNTVTGSDIEELFEDVGGLVESRLVRPGTAEVIYKTLADAQRAVEVYHNRQLDKQPMNCLLVNPRPPASTTQSSSGGKTTLPASSNSSVVPDISTFHKVLFRNL